MSGSYTNGVPRFVSAAWLSGSQRRRFPFRKLLAEIAIAPGFLRLTPRFVNRSRSIRSDSIHRAA
jgi:hypothetical protein